MPITHSDIIELPVTEDMWRRAAHLADQKLGWKFEDGASAIIAVDFEEGMTQMIVDSTKNIGFLGDKGIIVSENYSQAHYTISSDTSLTIDKPVRQKYMNFFEASKTGQSVRSFIRCGSDNIYDRYSYITSYRWRTIFVGEAGEEALKAYFESENISVECYNDVREDGYKDDDKYDFRFNSILIDAKASMDNNGHGYDKLLKHYNLIVPEDQTVKDITVQVVINEKMDTIWVIGWATKEMLEAKTPQYLGRGRQKGGKYHIISPKEINPMSTLKSFLGA